MNEKLITQFCAATNKLATDPSTEDLKVFIDTCFELFDNAIKNSKIKDDFEYYYIPGVSLIIEVKSKKINTEFSLGYDFFKKQLFFSSYIHYWQNIRNMKDEFMIDFFEVCTNNRFRFRQNSGPFYDKEITPEFNANYKSNIVNLMHNYVSAMLMPEKERQNITFGSLETDWDMSGDAQTIVSEFETAFKWFYKFNYTLWKSESIRIQNRNNRKARNKQ